MMPRPRPNHRHRHRARPRPRDSGLYIDLDLDLNTDIGLALLVFLENGEIGLKIPLLLQSDIGLDGPLAVFEFLCFYSKKLFGV